MLKLDFICLIFQVKKDRAERLGNSRNNISRRSSIRVLGGALAGKKTSRQASKAASQKISKAVDAMTNLGKKMRRPTLANGTVTFASNESTEEISGESEKNNESFESCNELQLEDEPEDEQEVENKETVRSLFFFPKKNVEKLIVRFLLFFCLSNDSIVSFFSFF